MANNIGGVVNIFVFIVAMLGDDVLTFFNHCGSNNNIIFFMANLLMVTLFFMNNVISKGTLGVSPGASPNVSRKWICLGNA